MHYNLINFKILKDTLTLISEFTNSQKGYKKQFFELRFKMKKRRILI